jgi:UDP-glucose 4-epimerase
MIAMSRSDTVLVTGGAGFIGTHVAQALVDRGQQVRILDDLSTSHPARLPPAADLAVGDIVDLATVEAAMAGVGRVVHLAARRTVPRSFADPAGTDRVNRAGTAIVLDAARRAGVRRVVFASSSSVYGDASAMPTPEDTPPNPMSPYAASKLAGERLCRDAAHDGVDTVCLRYFNVYGPGQRADDAYAMLMPRTLDALRRGVEITVHGDGHQRRDFTYITDAVAATLAALDAPQPFRGGRVNVAGGQSHSVLEVIHLLGSEVGVAPFTVHTGARSGDPRCTEADLTRARTLLGYEPAVTLEHGLRLIASTTYAAAIA